jgi:hypothetical protein
VGSLRRTPCDESHLSSDEAVHRFRAASPLRTKPDQSPHHPKEEVEAVDGCEVGRSERSE